MMISFQIEENIWSHDLYTNISALHFKLKNPIGLHVLYKNISPF